jgi:hypothetical protein
VSNYAHDIAISGEFVGTASSYISLDSIAVDKTKRGFIKIDVDGAEVDVLQSASRLLKSRVADILVEVHSKLLEDQCVNLLRANGYDASPTVAIHLATSYLLEREWMNE